MDAQPAVSAARAFLEVFATNGVDRAFLVPGESYLGILDALADVPAIEVMTCRHEAGAGFMACADARLTGRPALTLVSRGPGASNASIALHSAQQDAVPLVMIVGQVAVTHIGREAFQEIDYRRMFGGIAKWVADVREPDSLPEAAFKALRIAVSGTPGPVVIVVPEDIQRQAVPLRRWRAFAHPPTQPAPVVLDEIVGLLRASERPLLVAGGAFESAAGRSALRDLAEAWQLPVAVSFRRHDVFPNDHVLYAGDLGLANAASQIEAFHDSDLILALGTRMGDITTQGYRFPRMPAPAQTIVHCHADPYVVGLNFAPRLGVVCDPVVLARALVSVDGRASSTVSTRAWRERLGAIARDIARWPSKSTTWPDVVRALAAQRRGDFIVCLDAGSFAAPVYRHFRFRAGERMLAPISGAMGYGTPAAIAAQVRCPGAKVVCLCGDGGFMMTGNEMIAAAERRLPILFIVVDNRAYGSIWLHQERHHPGRHVGTELTSPDFGRLAAAFGVTSETVTSPDAIEDAVARGLAANRPYLLHVVTSLAAAPVPGEE